ncbi:hypothetical protein [Maribacter hydrothermalis]|uniref:DUF1735 domain-containing protein n=1 Tax=Maribacter hydrothermalis TaxID=1836467 RepID=A0A1B7ZC46_9FLAO|nr:hypothetical protein [Maribacter hydrothermalis]APQ17939.1 hypothetical protein BTR34_11640 [Maribacter hydrothermalis]OBR40481.1 hypothetical protein A9200_15295 [Maribacter hydrothermalis]
MKKYIKNIMILSLVATGFIACESSNKTIDDVFAEVTRGAVFRSTTAAADVAAQSFNFDDPSSTYSVTFEVEDHEQGALLQDVEVYTSFNDAVAGTSSSEALVTTLPASAFSANDFGLPSITVNTTLGELASALGLSPSDYTGGDSFTIRYVLNLTDGRSFSNDNLNSTVSGGSYFRSPFIYTIPLVCPPIAPTAGEWTLELQDSYGDSWNGASLSVTIDGVSTDYSHADGSSTTHTFTVPAGTVEIQIVYNSGSYDEENNFQVISANGDTVLDLGPSPTSGESLFDFCLPLDL